MLSAEFKTTYERTVRKYKPLLLFHVYAEGIHRGIAFS